MVKRSKWTHVAILKTAAAVHDEAMTERAESVEIEYRVKNTVVLAVSSRVMEPREPSMYFEGRKDMALKNRLMKESIYGNGSRPGGSVSLSPFLR